MRNVLLMSSWDVEYQEETEGKQERNVVMNATPRSKEVIRGIQGLAGADDGPGEKIH